MDHSELDPEWELGCCCELGRSDGQEPVGAQRIARGISSISRMGDHHGQDFEADCHQFGHFANQSTKTFRTRLMQVKVFEVLRRCSVAMVFADMITWGL